MRKAWVIAVLVLASLLLTGCPEAATPVGSCVADVCDVSGAPGGDAGGTAEAGGGAETEGPGGD